MDRRKISCRDYIKNAAIADARQLQVYREFRHASRDRTYYFRWSRDLVISVAGKGVRLRGGGGWDAAASATLVLAPVLLARSSDADDVDDDDVTGSTSGSDIQCLSVLGRFPAESVGGLGLILGSLSSFVLSEASSCCL